MRNKKSFRKIVEHELTRDKRRKEGEVEQCGKRVVSVDFQDRRN